MSRSDSPELDANLPSAPRSVLRELLECTELNPDDLEEHTRTVMERPRQILGRDNPYEPQRDADEQR